MEVTWSKKDIIPTSTGTQPTMCELNLTAKGYPYEIELYEKMLNKMFSKKMGVIV